MMAGFPHKKSVRARLRHVWDTYVNWGVKNPQKRKVLAQLTFSGMLSKETIKVAPFVEMQNNDSQRCRSAYPATFRWI